MLVFTFGFIVPADAVNVVSGARGWWGYGTRDSKGSTGNTSAGDFILAGGLGKSGQHGTHGDEWAVVGMVAKTIVEHGGYFCPYQAQCFNKRGKRRSWSTYYSPNGANNVGCHWICEPGYAGVNCISQTSPSTCDNKIYGPASGGKFAGLSLKTSGGDADRKEGEIPAFDTWMEDHGHHREVDIVLGIIKYLEHGVVAAPVKITCGSDNWKGIDSFVRAVELPMTNIQKLLCAPGYKANAGGTDCEPINADLCATEGMSFCSNFSRSGYDSSIHSIESSGSCAKFYCTNASQAFPKANDFTCVDCATGVKGGASTINGACVQCETGEYFDKPSNSCKPASAYIKPDMQYGKGKTKNNTDVKEQCWTMVEPDDYKACVLEGKIPTTN